jgi:hypothetical protein
MIGREMGVAFGCELTSRGNANGDEGIHKLVGLDQSPASKVTLRLAAERSPERRTIHVKRRH